MPTKPKRKPKVKAKKPVAYDPLASTYRTSRDFERGVRTRAQAQVQPGLDVLAGQEREQTRRHTGRIQDLGSWYGAEGDRLSQAFDKANQALNGLLVQQAGLSGQGQSALAGALRASGDKEAAEATRLGVEAPKVDPGILTAANTASTVGSVGLTGQFGNQLAEAARRIGISGTAGREAKEGEGRRYRGLVDELSDKRGELTSRLPGLTEEVRATMTKDERDRAAQRFQQELAGKEFGLSEQKFGLDKENTRFQQNLAQQELGLTERQFQEQQAQNMRDYELRNRELNNQIAAMEIESGSANEAQLNELRGKRYENALAAAQEYMKMPEKGQPYRRGGQLKSTYKRDPQQLYRILVNQLKLPRSEAIKLVRSMEYGFDKSFRDFKKPKKFKPTEKETKRAENRPLVPILPTPGERQRARENPVTSEFPGKKKPKRRKR